MVETTFKDDFIIVIYLGVVKKASRFDYGYTIVAISKKS